MKSLPMHLSGFPAAYPSEYSSTENHHPDESIVALDWPGNSEWHSNSGYQTEELSHASNNLDCMPEIEDEWLCDEVGKRLNQMDSVPFRSLSDQIYGMPEHHKFLREQIVNQLKSQPELYANYVPMAYDDYLKNMSKNGGWGDHVTLQAVADCYGRQDFCHYFVQGYMLH